MRGENPNSCAAAARPSGSESVVSVALGKRTRLFLVVASVLLWCGSFLLWAQRGVDRFVLVSHNALRADPFVASLFLAVAKYGMSFILLMYLAYLAVSWNREELRGARKIYLLVLFSWALAGAAGELLKVMVTRTRPFIEYAAEISAVIRPATWSFPSGHSTKSMAFVLPFLLLAAGRPLMNKIFKVLFLAAALSVCYSRIVLGVHYPSDILAGMGMAFVFLPVAAAAANAVYERRAVTEEKLRGLVLVVGAIMLILMFSIPFFS